MVPSHSPKVLLADSGGSGPPCGISQNFGKSKRRAAEAARICGRMPPVPKSPAPGERAISLSADAGTDMLSLEQGPAGAPTHGLAPNRRLRTATDAAAAAAKPVSAGEAIERWRGRVSKARPRGSD